MWHLAGFNSAVPFWHLAWARVFQAIGLPLFFVPLNTIAYSGLPPGKSNNASALLNLMRNLGGGIGISIAVTIIARRTQFHQNRLGSHFTMFDTAFVQQLNAMVARFVSQGAALNEATTHAMAVMYQSLQAQALMLSYIDVFKIMAVGGFGRGGTGHVRQAHRSDAQDGTGGALIPSTENPKSESRNPK